MRLFGVRGQSMMPTLPDGTDVVVDERAARESVRVGDIVAVAGPPREGKASRPLLHRVVAVLPQGVVTQGDGNCQEDGLCAWGGVLGVLKVARRPGEGWRRPRRWEGLPALALRRQRRGVALKRLLLRPPARWLWMKAGQGWRLSGGAGAPRAAGASRLAGATPMDQPPGQAGIEAEEIGNEVLLHNRASGEVLALNATGAALWRAMQSGATAKEALEAFHARYPGVAPKTLENDVVGVWSEIEAFCLRGGE